MRYNLALERYDYGRIDKLNSLHNMKTFWDDVRNLTRKVTSDHAIKCWQRLAERRYEELENENKKLSSINLEQFLKKFKENYNFLYDANGYVAGYNEALEAGEKFLEIHGDFVGEFSKYRGDFVSSDRELVAFMFTLNDITQGEN